MDRKGLISTLRSGGPSGGSNGNGEGAKVVQRVQVEETERLELGDSAQQVESAAEPEAATASADADQEGEFKVAGKKRRLKERKASSAAADMAGRGELIWGPIVSHGSSGGSQPCATVGQSSRTEEGGEGNSQPTDPAFQAQVSGGFSGGESPSLSMAVPSCTGGVGGAGVQAGSNGDPVPGGSSQPRESAAAEQPAAAEAEELADEEEMLLYKECEEEDGNFSNTSQLSDISASQTVCTNHLPVGFPGVPLIMVDAIQEDSPMVDWVYQEREERERKVRRRQRGNTDLEWEEPERPAPEWEEPERPAPEWEEPERSAPKRGESVRPAPKRGESVRPAPKRGESVRPQPKRGKAEHPQPRYLPAEGEFLLVTPPPPWEDCESLPPPPAEGQYLLVPPPPPWEDWVSLPPPPAEEEYLLVPPPSPWEDWVSLPPPPAEEEYLLVPPPSPWEDWVSLPRVWRELPATKNGGVLEIPPWPPPRSNLLPPLPGL
ncbi:UNVERIFIED_CONTAM: hypothetical protein FKN15_043622 [Acipenser sinensis]